MVMFLIKVCLVTTAKILQSKILPCPINLLLVISREKRTALLSRGQYSLLRGSGRFKSVETHGV